jgi:parvulin-like peptidyl-prolyl isomerase
MSSPAIQTGHPEAPEVALTSQRRTTFLFRKIVHEPLIHFLLLGAVILVASTMVNQRRDNAARTVVIDKNLVTHLIIIYEAQIGTPPSKKQLDSMIEGYIREEMQFREAKRMGLDKDDEIVRRRLASKFDFLQRDVVAVPDPSEEQLRRYFNSHQNAFLQPATVTFTHVYFSPDQEGDLAAQSRAEQTLTKLRSGSATRAPNLGDRFPLQTDYAGFARLDLVQQFGDSPIVDCVFATPLNQWSGPVRSGYGWHLVYVSHREEANVPPLEEIHDRLRAAYIGDVKEKANQEKYDALEKQYIIERTYQP